jgi:hypothetical protein
MVVALVFDGDFEVLPTHVEHGDEVAVFAIDGDLCLGRG